VGLAIAVGPTLAFYSATIGKSATTLTPVSAIDITYPPPTGYPLGTNRTFRLCTMIGIPILNAITKRDWRGVENIPRAGRVIVASNHVSYSDVLFLTQFLYENGRAPRYLGKESLFRLPIIGRILSSAGQIPVKRESTQAHRALDHAIACLEAGHLVGIYPEATLTRDANNWPMVAKTGIARLAIMTKTPVIPVAVWGTQLVLPAYSKRVHIWPRTRVSLHAGPPVDLSRWHGLEGDPVAMAEATGDIMKTLTNMLETMRGEPAPLRPFDPHLSDLPKTGNFKKSKKSGHA
jgi:1-acyl-sn-glycerol-3-phosphate acyltransferase